MLPGKVSMALLKYKKIMELVLFQRSANSPTDTGDSFHTSCLINFTEYVKTYMCFIDKPVDAIEKATLLVTALLLERTNHHHMTNQSAEFNSCNVIPIIRVCKGFSVRMVNGLCKKIKFK